MEFLFPVVMFCVGLGIAYVIAKIELRIDEAIRKDGMR